MKSITEYTLKNRNDWNLSIEVSLASSLIFLSIVFYGFPAIKLQKETKTFVPISKEDIYIIPIIDAKKIEPVSFVKRKIELKAAPISVENEKTIEKQTEAKPQSIIDPATNAQLIVSKTEEEPYEIFQVSEYPEIKSAGYKIHYPPLAKMAGLSGIVVVRALINKDGSIIKSEIVKSLGGGCDEEAIRYVEKLIFKPGMQNDQPVKVWMSIPVRFSLK